MKMGVFRRYPVPLENRKIKLLIDQRTDSRPFHYMHKEFFCFHGNLCQNQNGSTFLCQNNLTTSGLGLSLSPVKWPVSCILTTDLKLKFVIEKKKFLTKCMYLLTPDIYSPEECIWTTMRWNVIYLSENPSGKSSCTHPHRLEQWKS